MNSRVRTWVEISIRQIAANYRVLRAAAGDAEIMPVVKADAYNHGSVEVARALMAEGVRWFAVAGANEGVVLRAGGIDAGIVLMADFLPAERDAIIEYRLTPVLHAVDQIGELSAAAMRAGRTLPFHLKIDSGLGRLGTRAACSDIAAALAAARNVEFEGLMTHLASAEDFVNTQTEDQIASFEAACRALIPSCGNPRFIHLSGTNGIAYARRMPMQTMVRPGLSLYGYVSPATGDAPPCQITVQPALTWKASVLVVKDLPAGTPVGYNARYRTERPTVMAVIAAGYADGYPHRLCNTGKVIVNGTLAPIMGAVSMDLLTVDVTDCAPVRPGDAVTLLGREGTAVMDAQDMAALAGTIPYAILCGISKRPERIYVD